MYFCQRYSPRVLYFLFPRMYISPPLQILNLLCGSDELLRSGTGRALLRGCLDDVFAFEDDDIDGSNGRGGGESSSEVSLVGQREKPARSEGRGPDAFEAGFERLEDFASTVQQLPLAVQLIQVGTEFFKLNCHPIFAWFVCLLCCLRIKTCF